VVAGGGQLHLLERMLPHPPAHANPSIAPTTLSAILILLLPAGTNFFLRLGVSRGNGGAGQDIHAISELPAFASDEPMTSMLGHVF